MKRTLDLRTGIPVWQAYRTPGVPTKPLTRDAKADVLVVGMGISGAMMAEALAGDGMSVIAIDRRGPDPGLDRRNHRAGPVRDRSAAVAADRQDRQGSSRARVAALAAGPVQPEGAHCRAGDSVRPRRTQLALSRRQRARPRRASRGGRAAARSGPAGGLSDRARAERAFRHRPRRRLCSAPAISRSTRRSLQPGCFARRQRTARVSTRRSRQPASGQRTAR